MAGGSSVAGGDIEPRCVSFAGMLNLEIYETPRDSLPPELQVYWDINKGEWKEEWKIKNADGFHCAFYVPKKVNKGEDELSCPPVLVFRGSDSEPEDFAELAFATKLNLKVVVDKPWPATDVEMDFPVDQSFSSSDKFTGKTMAEMDGSGLTKEVLFTGVSGSTRVPISVMGLWSAEVRIDWTMDAALYYGENGDWAVDFAQGLGQKTGQYSAAIEAGKRAAADAEKDYGGRLILTGHSLGGGLASCATIAALKAKPNLRIEARTYNAAGLHENTAKEAGGSLATASQGPVVATHVVNEILSTMQMPGGGGVPILSDLMKWGGKSLPPAVSWPFPEPGISPGPMSISGKAYAPKGQPLPKLYPLQTQTLVTPAFSVGADIAGLASTSSKVEGFFDKLVNYIVTSLATGANLTSGEAGALQEALGDASAFPSDLQDKIKDAILHDGEVPTIDLTGSDYINNTVEPFLNSFLTDTVNLAKIFLASGEYHTFPPCAFTLIRPFLE